MSTDASHSGNLNPSLDESSPNQKPEPGVTNQDHTVPHDALEAGHDTDLPQTSDSPESLDKEITDGANRENIDPHHSITRPSLDTIDKEENGVN